MTPRSFKALTLIRGLFKTMSLAILGVFLILSLMGLGFFYYLTSSLPEVSKLKNFQHTSTTEVFSDEGRKIGEFTTERRYPVVFEKIPQHVVHAFIAAEDSKFYEHKGIDFQGILRAAFSNITRGRFAQGGSTITQQVARALLLETKKKEITRKIREMVLAWRMEKQLSKREIMSLYLKEIYLGHGAFGIGAASRNYFGKDVSELTVAEGSMLAGLPQRPNDWNPLRNPHLAKRRQSYVLKRMVEEGFIKEEQAKTSFAEPLRLRNLEDLTNSAAPYFTEYVRHYLMTKYGSEQILSQGYKVYTTVRYDFQKAAEKAMHKGLREVDMRLGWRGVTERIDDPKAQEEFLKNTQKEVLEALNPPRLLFPDVVDGVRGLEYDLRIYRDRNSKYVGATPITEGKYYRALVTEINDSKSYARAQVGQTTVFLPLNLLGWVKVDKLPLQRISQILKVGDLISIKVDKIDKKSDTATAFLDQEPEIEGALLSYETGNGFVRAMVGGKNFKNTKFNCALQTKRQVGSTFKPLMYAAAFDKGFSPASLVTDAPIVFKTEAKEGKSETQTLNASEEEWKPHNFGNKFEGDIPLRAALIRSMNIPTVKLLNEIGVDYAIQYAKTLGITSTLPRDLTIGLGSWSSSLEEIMRAYAIFPRLGKPVSLTYIKKVEDADGKIVEQYTDKELVKEILQAPQSPTPTPSSVAFDAPPALPPGNVISAQTAYVMTDLLKAVVNEGTGRAASVVKGAVAGKTGTSNDHRDAWFIGYSPNLMAGVWVGYLKDKTLDITETGGKAAAPIWAEYMTDVQENYSVKEFPIPDDIVFAYMDRATGKLASPASAGRVRVAFKVGTAPNQMGDNVLRVGEPGVRGTGSAAEPKTGDPLKPAIPRNEDDLPAKGSDETETNDFIRQEYQ